MKSQSNHSFMDRNSRRSANVLFKPAKSLSNRILAIQICCLYDKNDHQIGDHLNLDRLRIYDSCTRSNLTAAHLFAERANMQARVKIARILEDGPYVAIHFRLRQESSSWACFDIYRFNENGMVEELWTGKQAEYDRDRQAVYDLLAGPGEIKNKEDTGNNKKLLDHYYQAIVSGKVDDLSQFFTPGKFVEHRKPAGYKTFAEQNFRTCIDEDLSENMISCELRICEGNYSLSTTRSIINRHMYSNFHLHRWQNGKIVEHWLVRELIVMNALPEGIIKAVCN